MLERRRAPCVETTSVDCDFTMLGRNPGLRLLFSWKPGGVVSDYIWYFTISCHCILINNYGHLELYVEQQVPRGGFQDFGRP
jgi:hypothetical protein